MRNRRSFKRGQLVQDSNGNVFIYIKRASEISHVLLLNKNGDPIELQTIITKELSILKTPPDGFAGLQFK